MYGTEVSPFSLGREADTAVSRELCSKLRLQCWWLKGSVSLSSSVCFSVGCFVSELGFLVYFMQLSKGKNTPPCI